MTDKPDEQRKFWASWLPWRIFYLVGYVAFSVFLLVRFWRPPTTWTWWLLLAAMANTWIMFGSRIAREIQSFWRLSPERD